MVGRDSHIKPWGEVTNEERLEGANGLLLTPTADHLLDRGFITIEDGGEVLISPVAVVVSLRRMRLGARTKRQDCTHRQAGQGLQARIVRSRMVVRVVNASARSLVGLLLEDTPTVMGEASVRLPPRGTRWIAVYTGEEPGVQVARSTGLTDRQAALDLALQWEAESRRRRAERQHQAASGTGKVRVVDPGGFTQDQVAAILGLSPRSVRAIEKRAVRKLRLHPALRRLWSET